MAKKSENIPNSISITVTANGKDSAGVPCFDVVRTTVIEGKESVEIISQKSDAIRTAALTLTSVSYLVTSGLTNISNIVKE